MKRQCFVTALLVVAAFAAAFHISCADAGETFVMRGKVLDLSGRGVEGAEIFIYDSTNTRRPADFISPKSGRDGRYTIELPVGNYWAVARVRQGEKFGPLQLGTRHSGEPVVVEAVANGIAEQDFSVADIREVARSKQKNSENFIKLSGRVVDSSGEPVAMAYVLAHRGKDIGKMPDYVSAWTDETGRYLIYLSAGDYYLGASKVFPPGRTVVPAKAVTVAPGKIDIAIDVEIPLN